MDTISLILLSFLVCYIVAFVVFVLRKDLPPNPSNMENKGLESKPDVQEVTSLKMTSTMQEESILSSRLLESEDSAKRKPVMSKSSELTDEQSFRDSVSMAKTECINIISDHFSEEPEIFKDKNKSVLESNKQEKTCNSESNRSLGDLEFDKFRSFVDDKLLKEEMETLGVLHGLNKYIKDSFEKWNQLELNVAVTGNSGVGKSSLINSLRKLKPTDEGAAAVDVVETTMQGCKYLYPENPNVAIWDLPGIGTQTFTRDSYLEDMNFARFNVVLIVSAGRFLENDIWLGTELRALRKNIIFVRTKIDFDISNSKRDHPDVSETACLAKIRNKLSDKICLGGIPASVSGVYLVSSPERTKYDFVDLDKKLKDMLSTKGKAIRSILQNYVQIEIDKNQQMNKNGFRWRKTLSFLFGFVPTQALSDKLCKRSLCKISAICQQKFCIDDVSLDKTANEFNTPKMSIKEKVQFIKKQLNFKMKDEEGRLNLFGGSTYFQIMDAFTNPDRFWKVVKFRLPVFGMFFSAHNSYVTTKENIDNMCEEMAADQLRLALFRLDRLETDLKPIQ